MNTEELYNKIVDMYKKKLSYLKTFYDDYKDKDVFKAKLKSVLDNDIYNEQIKHYSFRSDNGYKYIIKIQPIEVLFRVNIEFNLIDFTYIESYMTTFADDYLYYLKRDVL